MIATGNAQYRGRFAPSPTGHLHLGSLVGALVSYLDAATHQGIWLVRIEDIDPPRELPGAATSILRTLEAHGLHWHETVRYQSDSSQLHQDAVLRLLESSQAFFCDCARKMLRRNDQLSCYPGTCRDRQLSQGALRLRVNSLPITVDDRWQGHRDFDLRESPGDFIVRRRDGLVAYQLACVVDDHDQNVTHVVRGIDLFDSTPRQILLQSTLGMPHPHYAHFPVLIGADGDKLSKQTGARRVDDATPAKNLCAALSLLGFAPPVEMLHWTPTEIVDWACQHYVTHMFASQTHIETHL